MSQHQNKKQKVNPNCNNAHHWGMTNVQYIIK